MTLPSVALRTHRDRVLEIAREHGAHNVRVFGSMAHDADRDGSDVDLLVHVDVRTPAEISRYIRDRVLAGARPL